MIEALIDIPTSDGPIDTFITRPQEGGPHPLVILYMDIWGLREELFDIARRIATTGYVCAVPNFYHREGKVRYDTRDAQNKVVSVDRLDPAVRGVMLGSLKRLTNAMIVVDTAALLAHFAADPGVAPGPKAALGYCMGGRHALCAAIAYPEDFRATISLHGTEMISEHADSPHQHFSALRGEVYCGFGEKDTHTPPALVARMSEVMRSCAVTYRHEVHPGASHGYAFSDRDVYDGRAAARDWEMIHAILRRQLRAQA